MQARALFFLARPIGRPMANSRGICRKTVQAPSWMMYQKLYQSVPFSAIGPKIMGLVQSIDTATKIPKTPNIRTGVNMAPPNRCTFCMMISLEMVIAAIPPNSHYLIRIFYLYFAVKKAQGIALCLSVGKACHLSSGQ